MVKDCLICKKEYKTKPSHAKRRKYCSYKCFDLARKETMKGENNPCWRGGKHKCFDCGKQLTHWGHRGQKDRCKSCAIKKNSGKNHYNWQGGKTPEGSRIRNSLEMKLWRKAVFERDDYTCVWCFQKGGKIEADHIKPFAYYPELRFAIDNGRTLCHNCHIKTDTYLVKSRYAKH